MASNLDLRRLRYFAAVCELGSFSKASQFLNVAQSALSQHVAALENVLGVPLLLRQPRCVIRTEAGDRLFEHARGLLLAAEQAELDVRSLATSAAGPVAVGLSYTAMEAIGLPFVQRVAEQLAGVKLRVMEGHSEVLYQWMVMGQADLALTFFEPQDDRFDAEALLEEELVCIGTEKFLGGPGPITLAEVLEFPLIMPGRAAVLQALATDPEERRRIARKVSLEIEAATSLKRAVAAGIGVSLQSRALASRELAAGTLVARDIVDPPMRRKLHLVSSRNRMASRAVIETRRLLIDTVRQANATGQWPGRPCHVGMGPT
ncbi:MAG TPA: LysR substrate-binding domain-containing protein [Arenibaculum sp.]|nr:LysR substrate-binding domain-containing protein [Arenibaculum sp.]